MARRERRRGREVFNQFFLRQNYINDTEFEEAIKDRLKNPYWMIGRKGKILMKQIRNQHGARIIVYEHR